MAKNNSTQVADIEEDFEDPHLREQELDTYYHNNINAEFAKKYPLYNSSNEPVYYPLDLSSIKKRHGVGNLKKFCRNINIIDVMKEKGIDRKTDFPILTNKQLQMHALLCYLNKKALLIGGEPGVGKSETVVANAKRIAKHSNRTFIDWRQITDVDLSIDTESTKKKEDVLQKVMFSKETSRKIHIKNIIENIDKYFIFIDLRVAGIENVDIQGIPQMQQIEQYSDTKMPKWVYLMALAGSAGILFLDELNQGDGQTLKALFEVVLDKSAAGRAFSDLWGIVAAGNIDNIGSVFDNTEIPPALLARFSSIELMANPYEWAQWAVMNNIHTLVIDFIMSNKSDMAKNFIVNTTFENKNKLKPNPRNLKVVSDFIYKITRNRLVEAENGLHNEFPIEREIKIAAESICGSEWANSFYAFLTLKSFSWVQLLDMTPQEFSQLQASEKYRLKSFIAGEINPVIQPIHDLFVKDYCNEDRGDEDRNKFNENLQKNKILTKDQIIKISEFFQIILMVGPEWAAQTISFIKKRDKSGRYAWLLLTIGMYSDLDKKIKEDIKKKLIPSLKDIISTNNQYDENLKKELNKQSKE